MVIIDVGQDWQEPMHSVEEVQPGLLIQIGKLGAPGLRELKSMVLHTVKPCNQ